MGHGGKEGWEVEPGLGGKIVFVFCFVVLLWVEQRFTLFDGCCFFVEHRFPLFDVLGRFADEAGVYTLQIATGYHCFLAFLE